MTAARPAQDLASAFERQAAQHPDRPALGSLRNYRSYRELNESANRMAHLLLAQDPPPGSPVAVLMAGESIDAIVAAIAILKAGCAVLMLDSSAMPKRHRQILAEARPAVLLTDQKCLTLAVAVAPDESSVIAGTETSTSLASTNPGLKIDADSVCGIYFTSGSTGKPRGVLQTHCNVLHNIRNYTATLQVTVDDRFSLLSPLHMLASCSAIYGALLNGACVFPFDVRSRGFPAMHAWIKRKKITILHCVPTLFRRFCDSLVKTTRLKSVRIVKLGGEAAMQRDATRVGAHFAEDCVLVNGLGMSEANGNVTHLRIECPADWDDAVLPVGKPLDGFAIEVVDAAGRQVADGEIGEIVVESRYLSPGYHNHPQADAERFQSLPDRKRRRFRSGDLGRLRPDGLLEHCGRIADELKIRGHRVSTLEVESALLEHPGVAEVAVVACRDGDGALQLLACFVPGGTEEPPKPEDLRAFLATNLPPASLPSRWIAVAALPLTANGKIDRRRLRTEEPERIQTEGGDDVMSQVIAGWRDILPQQDLSANSDFFACGGDSLSALFMLARAESTFGVSVSLFAFSEEPSVENLVRLIENPELRRESERPPVVLTLRPGGVSEALFVIPGAGSDVSRLLPLAARWNSPRPLCAFQWRGINGREAAHDTIESAAEYFLEAMRVVQPSGPYHLCGTSFGGRVAFEMARMLIACGETVGSLNIVDTRLPRWLRPEGHSPRKSIARLLYRLNPVGGQRRPDWRSAMQGLAQWRTRRAARRCAERCFRGGTPVPHTDRQFYLLDVALQAARRHRMQPYPGDVLLLRTASLAPPELFRENPTLGWEPFIEGKLEVAQISGSHGDFLLEPHVAKLAKQLGDR